MSCMPIFLREGSLLLSVRPADITLKFFSFHELIYVVEAIYPPNIEASIPSLSHSPSPRAQSRSRIYFSFLASDTYKLLQADSRILATSYFTATSKCAITDMAPGQPKTWDCAAILERNDLYERSLRSRQTLLWRNALESLI